MFLAALMVLVLTAQSSTLVDDCSPAHLQFLEEELRRVSGELSVQESTLSRMRADMRGLSASVETAREDAQSVRGRRKLEGLMRDSRKLAAELSAVDGRAGTLRQQVRELTESLYTCYRAKEDAVLELLLVAIRARDNSGVATELGNLEVVTTRLRALPRRAPGPVEPVLLADPNSVTTPFERRLLADALLDHHDRAVRDSTKAFNDVVRARKTKDRASEASELLKVAGRTGLDGGGFFEGLDNVDAELERAQKEVAELDALLVQLRKTIAFYVDQLEILRADSEGAQY